MKKLISLSIAVLLSAVLIVSCDDKDDPAGLSLIGTWKFSSRSITACTDPGDNLEETCTGGIADCGYVTITATGYSYTPPTNSPDPVETGTYTSTATTLVVTPARGGTNTLTYTLSATTLTFSETDASSNCVATVTLTRD